MNATCSKILVFTSNGGTGEALSYSALELPAEPIESAGILERHMLAGTII
jgi:hypothetical protein